MQIDVVTIFPEMFPPVLNASILKRAQDSGIVDIQVHNLRDYTHDQRRTVDDRPYGGGPGMVMKPEPIFEAVEALRAKRGCEAHRIRQPRTCETILLSPKGEPLSAGLAKALAALTHVLLICGRYEGVDERVRIGLADRTLSIGDYVLTGGELPAMVAIDALARFIPGVLGHAQATEEESFAEGWLEYPHYTRPPTYRGMTVPEELLSGDHEAVARWRKAQATAQTLAVRPEMITSHQCNRSAKSL
ncbi:MAG: tRNA (guanosine(37)-N1)-methyltransferase TrmD [Candidatus Omnitrophica bacterium]|nr:tRNA (guanosine(37)-N1)-methyltransferase TrmD [Candidatus Omnitrophota bacterium]